jgi:hypothetical protein
MVPRGGIELSSILLNQLRFLDSPFPVYPSMYPALKSYAARGQRLGHLSFHEEHYRSDTFPPKVEVTRSNRIGRARFQMT